MIAAKKHYGPTIVEIYSDGYIVASKSACERANLDSEIIDDLSTNLTWNPSEVTCTA